MAIDLANPKTITPDLLPGLLQVIKRDGRLVSYDEVHIETAIKKAFLAVEGHDAEKAQSIHKIARDLTQ